MIAAFAAFWALLYLGRRQKWGGRNGDITDFCLVGKTAMTQYQ
jgi:hypothetical protein